MNNLETRKRKNEEELESSKQKWSKSLSFDCPRNVDNSSSSSWIRHSTGNFSSRDAHSSGKMELSETNRKVCNSTYIFHKFYIYSVDRND